MKPSSEGILTREFYTRSTVLVARELLGRQLVRVLNGNRVGGIITETEAYVGEEDQGCHARAGRTPRTSIMYGPAGFAYVYFTYGMHWMLNAVTEVEGFPAAVLIRAIHPKDGKEIILSNRKGKGTDGPAKLTQALDIRRDLNHCDLCTSSGGLWVEFGQPIPDEFVTIGTRVGLNNVPEPWFSKPWRFRINYEKWEEWAKTT
jgi:DNA-3-methyladenine glycosylase